MHPSNNWEHKNLFLEAKSQDESVKSLCKKPVSNLNNKEMPRDQN